MVTISVHIVECFIDLLSFDIIPNGNPFDQPMSDHEFYMQPDFLLFEAGNIELGCVSSLGRFDAQQNCTDKVHNFVSCATPISLWPVDPERPSCMVPRWESSLASIRCSKSTVSTTDRAIGPTYGPAPPPANAGALSTEATSSKGSSFHCLRDDAADSLRRFDKMGIGKVSVSRRGLVPLMSEHLDPNSG